MSFKVNLIFCIIVVLWTSSPGQTTNTTLTGNWLREIEKCASGGRQESVYKDKIRDGPKDALPFDSINLNTTVKVEGEFELWLGTKSLSVSYPELDLSYTSAYNDTIYYCGALNEAFQGWLVSQSVILSVTLGIHRNGDYTLENYVFASSHMAVYCASAKSLIRKITVIN